VASQRTRRGVYVAIAVVSLALYNGALVVFVVQRRAVDATPAASATAALIAPASSASPPQEASESAPAPSVNASASAPLASSTPRLAAPQRPAPARIQRPPAPARTAKPASDVLNPWSYE